MPPKKKTATTKGADEAQALDIQTLVGAVNGVFGEGALTMASDPDLEVRRWPTGIAPIDYVLDGGIPRGRFLEFYGSYSTMKSYVLYKALGACQQAGGKVGLIDTEHSFDPEWATMLGVDVSNLPISRPQTAEQGIGVLESLIRQKFDMLGFDSIAAAIPQQHQESKPGEDTQPGALARVMSKGLARLNAANKHTAVIFVNQTREKIGVSFGSPTTTSGGKAMGFYASYRLSYVRIQSIKEDVKRWDGQKEITQKLTVAHKIQATLEKSKLSRPQADVIFDYDLRTGQVDNRGFLVARGLEDGLITRSSSGHWDIPGVLDKPIHGAPKWIKYLDETPEVEEWLVENVMPKTVLAR